MLLLLVSATLASVVFIEPTLARGTQPRDGEDSYTYSYQSHLQLVRHSKSQDYQSSTEESLQTDPSLHTAEGSVQVNTSLNPVEESPQFNSSLTPVVESAQVHSSLGHVPQEVLEDVTGPKERNQAEEISRLAQSTNISQNTSASEGSTSNTDNSDPGQCHYSLVVNQLDSTKCPVLLKQLQQPQPQGDDARSATEALYLQGLASATKRLDSLEDSLRVEREESHSLQKSLQSQLELVQHADVLAGLTQSNITRIVSAIRRLQITMEKQRSLTGGMETKMSGLIMDVAELQRTNKLTQDHETDVRGKTVKVQAPGAFSCDGVINATTFKDCEDVYNAGHTDSGVYYITPIYVHCPIPVYCDMTAPPGGWLVIQRRQDGHTSFNRSWAEYRRGFGDVTKDFWLGNDAIFLLTNQDHYELRVDLWDFYGSRVFAQYLHFKLEGEREKFTLRISNHSGTAPDGLSNHNNVAFSTPDHDNDEWHDYHCAQEWGSGWWFNNCWFVILNGPYHNTTDVQYRGISWNEWKAEQLQHVEMKIRPAAN